MLEWQEDWLICCDLLLPSLPVTKQAGWNDDLILTSISGWICHVRFKWHKLLLTAVLLTAGRRTASSFQINTVRSHARLLSVGARLSLRSWEEYLNHFDVWCLLCCCSPCYKLPNTCRVCSEPCFPVNTLLHYWGKGTTALALFIVNILTILIKV